MNAKLIRWTIGPVSTCGKEILRESVAAFKHLYPDIRRVVCYNHLDPEELANVDAELYEQVASSVGFSLRPPDDNPEEASGCGWKLVPPRLCPEGYELWLDNDLIITKRLSSLDSWFTSASGIIAEGLHRRRMYGEFDRFVSPGLHICAGLFGLPPGFDFEEQILHYVSFATKSLGGYDEQGLTTAIITNMPDWILVPLSELYISEDHVPFPEFNPPAIHFVGVNRKPWHRGWQAYQRRKII